MTEHCRRRLASYKVPREMLVDELPRSSVGKVLRRALRGQRAASVSRPVRTDRGNRTRTRPE